MSDAAATTRPGRRAALAVIAAAPAAFLAACAGDNPAPGGVPIQPVHVIFFEDDSIAVGPTALNVIQDAAQVARRFPQAPIRVLGFIAPDPNDAPTVLQARRLSRTRADRVVAELVNLGIPQDRIQVLGRGQASFADIPLEARRVEIHIGSN
jgi:outer membrane protein OmpA-like peptidoglycan-associated protein